MAYSEFRFYSPAHDAVMVRVSMWDARGSEFFMLIPATSGKSYRHARTDALTAIEQAISMGLQPGMVVVA